MVSLLFIMPFMFLDPMPVYVKFILTEEYVILSELLTFYIVLQEWI